MGWRSRCRRTVDATSESATCGCGNTGKFAPGQVLCVSSRVYWCLTTSNSTAMTGSWRLRRKTHSTDTVLVPGGITPLVQPLERRLNKEMKPDCTQVHRVGGLCRRRPEDEQARGSREERGINVGQRGVCHWTAVTVGGG